MFSKLIVIIIIIITLLGSRTSRILSFLRPVIKKESALSLTVGTKGIWKAKCQQSQIQGNPETGTRSLIYCSVNSLYLLFPYLAARLIAKCGKILEFLHKTLCLKERFYYEYSEVSMSQTVSQEGHLIGGGWS